MTPARGQNAESPADLEKKKAFLKAREQMRAVPLATPPPTTPKPKPKPAPQPITPKPKATPEPEPTPRPQPPPEKPEKPEPTPRPRVTPGPTPAPRPPVTPPPVTPAPPATTPVAPVTVQKSGFEEEEVVPAEKEREGWFFGGPKYKYLTRSLRSQIDNAPVRRNRWRYIVVHNSGTRQGSAKAFNYYHLHVRKMPNGLAYHFVIGNGTSSGDGQIEIGSRWTRQINGGHVHSDYLNNIALGICLVGDYNRSKPTERQLEALEELIKYLRKRVGRVEGKVSIVKAHREINPPRWPTDCPGNRFPYRWLHGKFD
jgi:N-acetylmuramoyl-L-alanine amidase